MAKTQTKLAVSPLKFTLGHEILGETDGGVSRVSQLNNWLFGKRPECHFSAFVGKDGPGPPSDVVGSLALTPASGSLDPIVTHAFITADAALGDATFSAQVEVPASNEVTLTIAVVGNQGTVADSIVFLPADNGSEKTVVIDLSVATVGEEFVKITVTMQHTFGSNFTAEVIELNFEEDEITAGLPDPPNVPGDDLFVVAVGVQVTINSGTIDVVANL